MPQLVAEKFATFCQVNGIKHICISPYHPSSNGLAKKFVQTFKMAMRKSVKDGFSLSQRLSSFLHAYQATPQATTLVPPAVLSMGRNLCTCLDLLRPNLGIAAVQHQSRQKEHHACHSKPRSFHVGQACSRWVPATLVHVGQACSRWVPATLVHVGQACSRWVPATLVQELGPVSVTA